MTQLKVNLKIIKPALVKIVAGALANGQVAVLPTDTIYGLSCVADNSQAIRRIYRLKRRDFKKPLILLAASLAMVKKYAFVSRRQEEHLKQIYKSARPTTVILRSRGLLPPALSGNSDGLAWRLPKNDFLIKILKIVRKPLVSTSFNLSGQPDLIDLQYLPDYFSGRQRPDLVVNSGQCRRRRPSRLIDLRREDRPLILRK